jgi:hypothetical protein
MGREHATLAHRLHVHLRDGMQAASGGLLLQQGQREERRMSLVHVIGLYPVISQGPQHRHTPQPQHDFLTQTVAQVAAVEAIGEALTPGTVFFHRRIQEIHRHGVPEHPTDKVTPRAHAHQAPLNGNGHARR